MNKYSFMGMRGDEFRRARERHDPVVFNDIIRFLEDDPFEFRTGYYKQRFWKYLNRIDLSDQQIARLEKAAKLYLMRPPSREFRPMCVLMSRIATDDFWIAVRNKVHDNAPVTRLSASCLYTYSEGHLAGEENRQKMEYLVMNKYAYTIQMKTQKDLQRIVTNRKQWREIPYLREILTHEQYVQMEQGFEKDAALISDIKFTLQKLSIIMGTAFLSIFNEGAWNHALDLLLQANDEQAVTIVGQFLDRFVFFGFDPTQHEGTMRASFGVLDHYSTQEALKLLEQYADLDRTTGKN